MVQLSYPRAAARTRGFTLGRPRGFAVVGQRVFFLRTGSATDPVAQLWTVDPDGGERLLADPRTLLAQTSEVLTDAERARRERSRETGSGVVGYSLDDAGAVAAFTLSGGLFAVDVVSAAVAELPAAGPVLDPRVDPTGHRVAYLSGGELRVAELDGTDRLIAGEAQVSWGAAEFVAAEEMARDRGYWWAPDGRRLLVARVDERSVQRWWIADPANPDRGPRSVAYPAAGTANADVSLAICDLDGARIPVDWDRCALPYLTGAGWCRAPGAWIGVMTRDQRRAELRLVDGATGGTELIEASSDSIWLDVVPGVPAWTADGRLVTTVDDADTRRLVVGGELVSPPGLQVTRVVHAGSGVVFTAREEPTERAVYRFEVATGALERLTDRPGVHDAVAGDELIVITSEGLDFDGERSEIHRPGVPRAEIASLAAAPPFRPEVSLLRCGERELRTGVVLPREGRRPAGALPVLLDPYGGPHAQRVLAASGRYLNSQWFADQGFAVVVCDGRGTPGRGPAWERSVHHDLATAVLEDQIEGLHEAASRYPGELDLDRVAIRGWSFGGYLAALAVLRRPDVFQAGIAGAPVTDWRLYDTFYTERYLGQPAGAGDAYERCSLLGLAAGLRRPLLLIHGLADDNVVVAHTLRLSAALLQAGRAHTVLPLSGVTHMTPQEDVAESLLLLQAEFLASSLAS